ncbi:hypothetical protein MKW94_010292 [Papaver nudicaule]|uniref:Cytochrome P450 n=1 Tax=Papaver nudicaule TaxID=74823 RepID=A0AA41V573_PAPNU|nr:hypothetical protein [Papaver nudicaule]
MTSIHFFLVQNLGSTVRSHYYFYYHFMILLLVFMITFLVVLFKQQRRNAKWILPPGPRRLPVIGNLHQLGSDLLHVSLEKLSKQYGPLMYLQLGSIPTLVVSSAEMAKEIMKTHDLVFSNRPTLYAAKKLFYGCSDIGFATYGEYWREARKIAILELLSAKRVLSYRAVREEEVALAIELIRQSSSSFVPVNLSEILLCLLNNIVCRVAFSVKYFSVQGEGDNNSKTKFNLMLQETGNLIAGFSTADLFPWMGWIHKFDGLDTRLEKNYRQFDEFFNKVIEAHLNTSKSRKPDVEDFVDVLLRVQEDTSQSIRLTTNQMKGIIKDVFVAGTDTSAAALVWTMTELIRNPIIMKRVQEEVRTETGTKDMVEESDLHKLSYTKLVIKEALRLHPPVPLLLPRETREKCTIDGYDIPMKTTVLINAKAISTDPKYWKEPDEFRPERFLDSNIDYKGQDFELIPFGGGRRGCPGINFSAVLVELVLANLLHSFDWKLPSGMTVKQVDMNEAFGLVMHKKIPLCLVADNRK